MKNKLKISADDGCASDIRLSDLCVKFGIELVIYLPVEWNALAASKGYRPLNYLQVQALSVRHELGAHTITHRHITDLPIDEAKYEIEASGQMLEELFGVEVTKFAPPRGYTNPELTEFTLGIYESQRLTKEPGLVHIHPDSGVNGNKPWRQCITKDTEELWCHSYELDRFNLWGELEEYLEASA